MKNSIETYKIYSDFYDLYVGKFDSDFDFYKSYCNKNDKVLEIGCGTGRILNLLLNTNCKVTGVDISQEMLDKASEKFIDQIKEGQLSLINHNFVSHKLNERFDRILVTFYTLNYIHERPVDFLRNVHNSLKDNGVLLIDMFYPSSLHDKSLVGKWFDKEYNIDGQFFKIRIYKTIDNDIEHRRLIFINNETETKMESLRKYFSPLTLKEMLKSAGYRSIEFSYDYDYRGFKEMIDEKRLKDNYIVKVKK